MGGPRPGPLLPPEANWQTKATEPVPYGAENRPQAGPYSGAETGNSERVQNIDVLALLHTLPTKVRFPDLVIHGTDRSGANIQHKFSSKSP